MGMLATTGVIVSEDTFGPVSDNAAGIAEMSGEFHGEPEKIMVSLDAVGNTTKAVTKGFAIGSAVIASVAIFASFIETAVNELLPHDIVETAQHSARGVFDLLPINVADPKVFIGLLIGGSVPFLFSALAINAVSRTAGVVVQEVRRQFADGQIMAGTKQPDHGPVIDICTKASLRELVTPALLAVLTPVIVGFGIGFTALGAFLVAVILVGQLMANYLSNAGGAWDNAKKYIEDGNEGGKGSDSYRAAVIADTVGDPFKDTAGPALNPLIKVMNLVSLLIVPAMLGMAKFNTVTRIATPKGGSVAIAGAALVVLIGAVAFSKRPSSGFGTDEEFAAASAAAPAPVPHTAVAEAVEEELVSPAVPARATATKTAARKAPAKKAAAPRKAAAKKATVEEGGPGQEGHQEAHADPRAIGPTDRHEAPAPAGASSRAGPDRLLGGRRGDVTASGAWGNRGQEREVHLRGRWRSGWARLLPKRQMLVGIGRCTMNYRCTRLLLGIAMSTTLVVGAAHPAGATAASPKGAAPTVSVPVETFHSGLAGPHAATTTANDATGTCPNRHVGATCTVDFFVSSGHWTSQFCCINGG